MIANGTLVRTSKHGDWLAVEDLQIGASIYDPLAEASKEITDILEREISFVHDAQTKRHPLYPVVLDQDLLGRAHPKRPIVVSPGQYILAVKQAYKAPEMRALALQTALQLSGDRPADHDGLFACVRYFAVFTQSAQLMDASGVLLRSYPSDVYQRDPALCRVEQGGLAGAHACVSALGFGGR